MKKGRGKQKDVRGRKEEGRGKRKGRAQDKVAVRNESLINKLREALVDVEDKPEIIPEEEGIIEVDISSLAL